VFEDRAGDSVPRALLTGPEFHNTSMTYFPDGFTATPPPRGLDVGYLPPRAVVRGA
jgi:hypothetical protein